MSLIRKMQTINTRTYDFCFRSSVTITWH